MSSLFNTPSGDQESSYDLQGVLQRQADAYVQATQRSLEALEGIVHEWVSNRRVDLEKTQDTLQKITEAKDKDEALDIYQTFVIERSRTFAEEAIAIPGKLGSIGLHAADVVRSIGFPVPLPMAPIMPFIQFAHMMRGPTLQMMRAIPEAGKKAVEQVDARDRQAERRIGERAQVVGSDSPSGDQKPKAQAA